MKKALVVGGGRPWEDLERLEKMMGRSWDGIVIAVNEAGVHWPRRLDHWATLHGEKIQKWRDKRQAKVQSLGRNPLWDRYTTWSCIRRSTIQVYLDRWTRGSSGLYGVSVATSDRMTSLLGAPVERIVLCGIPMDRGKNVYTNRDWTAADRYVAHWLPIMHELRGRVKSMSGWTRSQLGEPSVDWLENTVEMSAAVG